MIDFDISIVAEDCAFGKTGFLIKCGAVQKALSTCPEKATRKKTANKRKSATIAPYNRGANGNNDRGRLWHR